MLPFQDRYSRQRMLPEVGKRGQERIEALRVVVRGGPEAAIEFAYLRGAGVGELELQTTNDAPPEAWPHAALFTRPGPRAVGLGAWAALRRLREALAAIPGAAPSEDNDPPRDRS